jgi:hypothetical protein
MKKCKTGDEKCDAPQVKNLFCVLKMATTMSAAKIERKKNTNISSVIEHAMLPLPACIHLNENVM